MDARTENELAMLLDGLRLYDDTGCFTRFLAALVVKGWEATENFNRCKGGRKRGR